MPTWIQEAPFRLRSGHYTKDQHCVSLQYKSVRNDKKLTGAADQLAQYSTSFSGTCHHFQGTMARGYRKPCTRSAQPARLQRATISTNATSCHKLKYMYGTILSLVLNTLLPSRLICTGCDSEFNIAAQNAKINKSTIAAIHVPDKRVHQYYSYKDICIYIYIYIYIYI